MICQIGRNAGFDQPSPERLDYLILLIANMVMWSIKIGRRWSQAPFYPNMNRITNYSCRKSIFRLNNIKFVGLYEFIDLHSVGLSF